jgi:predicted nucleic-acid-binding protein
MIALDTDVVLRLLIPDDDRQQAEAKRLMDDAMARGEVVLLTDIVLCELDWVLRSAYAVPADRRIATLQALLDDPGFVFENRERALSAVEAATAGGGDLADHLLGLRARELSASTTYTFDRELRGDPRFTVI